ncbi:MAG: AAA family ATPase [Alphaproteobacteria bacterium]|nr:AAA family ATPase [Alphaproteobacteria bacterium]
MQNSYIKSFKINGFLSFAKGASEVELNPLNVIIGPNGSGKSNLVEAMQLLSATPSDFAGAVRRAGGIDSLLWQGKRHPVQQREASFEIKLGNFNNQAVQLDYRIAFNSQEHGVFVVEEEIIHTQDNQSRMLLHYRCDEPLVTIQEIGQSQKQKAKSDLGFLKLNQSILSQLRDQENYPTLYWLSDYLNRMQFFRGWSFGPEALVRQPQRVDDPTDYLLPDARNLALVINELVLQHWPRQKFHSAMQKFLPRFERCALRISEGAPVLYLHEQGNETPIPASRMSDGTLRFIAILAALLAPNPPSLLCIEEPEIGMHPRALNLLGELICDAATRMQIMVVTHSDQLIHALRDQQSSIMFCDNEGHGTILSHLSPSNPVG